MKEKVNGGSLRVLVDSLDIGQFVALCVGNSWFLFVCFGNGVT